MRVYCVFEVPWWPGGLEPRGHQETTQRRACICSPPRSRRGGALRSAARPTPTEDTSASERRACARTCDDAYRHADDRRPTMAGAARMCTRECKHTTTPSQQPAGAAARYTMARSTTPEDASASKRRTHATIRSTGPTHDGKKRSSNQRRARGARASARPT